MSYHKTSVSEAFRSLIGNSGRRSHLRYLARASLNWQFDRRQHPAIVRVDPQGFLGRVGEIRLLGGAGSWGETPLNDLSVLSMLTAARRPRRAFEFGTYTGVGTLHIAANSPPECSIVTLDLPQQIRPETSNLYWERDIEGHVIGSRFVGTLLADKINQVFGDSRTFDYSPYLRTMDLVWIDAGHDYECVAEDSKNAESMLSAGGVIAWHDFSRACPGVVRLANEWAASGRKVQWFTGTQVVFWQSEK